MIRQQSMALNYEDNPFVSIKPIYRNVLKLYFFLFLFGSPIMRTLANPVVVDYTYVRLFLDLVFSFLTFLPIFFYRRHYGWLHPLIFPLMFRIIKDLSERPGSFLSILDTSPYIDVIYNEALVGFSQWEVALADVDGKLLQILAILVYYIGFFYGPQLKVPKVRELKPKMLSSKVVFVVGITTVAFLLYLQSRGGITAHFNSWAGGRYQSLGGDGFIFAFLRMGFIATLIWFALDPKSIRNPIFWACVLLTLPVTFISQGSRSSILYSILLLFMVVMIRNAKLPSFRILVVSIPILLIIGVLGEIRRSTFDGSVNWELFTSSSFLDAGAYVASEISDKRAAASGYLPIIAKVPEDVDLLYGKTYLAALTFYIPRALWPEKPRGAGAYTGQLIFNRSAGIPPGPVAEAFWNFHIPGVILVFLFFGIFHNWLARYLLANPGIKVVHVIYILTLFYCAPTTIKMVAYFQQIVPAIMILIWVNAMSLSKKTGSYATA